MSVPYLPPPSDSETAALLRISALHIVLPQREVAAVLAASEVETGDAQPFSVGGVLYAGQRWPVYCLSPELALDIVIAPERSTCVVLATRSGYLGIMCDETATIQVAPAQQHALPPAMRTPDTPVTGLVELVEGVVACRSTGDRLAAHISKLTGQ